MSKRFLVVKSCYDGYTHTEENEETLAGYEYKDYKESMDYYKQVSYLQHRVTDYETWRSDYGEDYTELLLWAQSAHVGEYKEISGMGLFVRIA